jgi:predicted kinase
VREVVVVSGAPGAGKSTLARPLAAELRFPLLSKDTIKESLFDHLGHVAEDEFRSSQLLGGAAMELLWGLAVDCPSVVLEANFRSQSPYEREKLLSLASRPVEIYCRVPIEVAHERYALRGASANHHPVHVARALPIESFEEFQHPFGIGHVIEVDTTQQVDIPALAWRVSAVLES